MVMFLVVVQDHVDNGIDIGDGDFAVSVDVTDVIAVIVDGYAGMAGIASHDDNVNHAVGIGDGYFSVPIDVARDHYRIIAHSLVDDFAVLDDMAQAAPLLIVSIGIRAARE